MASFDWKSIVGKIAPWIGTALGGPLGGSATAAVCSALGLDAGASDDQIQDKIAGATPDQLLALKQADQAFQEKMTQIGFDQIDKLDELSNSDRDSARKREIEVKDWTPRILAYGVTIGFFGLLAYLAYMAVPSANKGDLDIMLGSLGTAWVSIVGYYFGSSAGSDAKTKLLGKQAAS